MTDADGLSIVQWSVRLAVACYAARTFTDAGDIGTLGLRRSLWTAGLAFYATHVVAAFAFVHGWSHDNAWRETARQTTAVVGWESGFGIWMNYAFTLFWLADVAAWWVTGPDYPNRFRRTYVVVQTVFAFLVFNATAVFGPPFWRPVVAAFLLLIAVALVRRGRRAAR